MKTDKEDNKNSDFLKNYWELDFYEKLPISNINGLPTVPDAMKNPDGTVTFKRLWLVDPEKKLIVSDKEFPEITMGEGDSISLTWNLAIGSNRRRLTFVA